MDPTEIRSIRGSLSRAAFARLLGVTALTVLRWELPDGSKEARRPRAKMIEALRRLAADGVGTSGAGTGDDDDDDDASEEAPPEKPAVTTTAAAAEVSEAEARVLVLLQRLNTESWAQAENELMLLLAGSEPTPPAVRTLATLGLAQAQLLARFDIRGALTTLLPILEEAQRGTLPRHVAARAHVMGAVLFGAPDSRTCDAGRVNVHAALADSLLDPEADDLHVLLALGRISVARFVNPHVVSRVYNASAEHFERATSPLSLCLRSEMRAIMARVAGDATTAAKLGEETIERAERLAHPPIIVAVLAFRAYSALRGTAVPADVLVHTTRAREAAKAVLPAEPFLRVLGSEIEAYERQGKLAEAEAVYREALALSRRSRVPLFPVVPVVARIFALQHRIDDLEQLARDLVETGGDTQLVGRNALVEIHANHVRAFAALISAAPERAAELADRVIEALERHGTTGTENLVHDAHVLWVFAHVFDGKPAETHARVRRFESLFEERPSLWHSAVLRRLTARACLLEGRGAEARQYLETAKTMFELLEDVVQAAQCRYDLALAAQMAGAPHAQEQVAAAAAELDRLRIPRAPSPREFRPEMLLGADSSASAKAWAKQSMTERVAGAVERLSARGLPPSVRERELSAILADLFPGRTVEIDFGEEGVRIGIGGDLGAEERAVIRTLTAVASAGLERARSRASAGGDTGIEIDPVLPGFIAAAPATRQLKRELAQLGRSNATILVTGESGSGKEVVARGVHDLSGRAKGPYVAFNCASIPRELFEGQLFGYKKGAFTGATSDSPGVIRAAAGGTLFLDEIGELPLDIQPKLLRFLENGEILPLGEQSPRRVDVRVLAATHRDLGRLVREGLFREDLYYRLNVVPLHVPPLRQRKEDIVALARVFASKLAPEGETAPELGTDAIATLKGHTWPGNVRELRNVIERAMAYAPIPSVLRSEHLRI